MNYRDILVEELNQRTQGNASYSLRAFARDIGLTPGSLSSILNGSKGLSRDKAHFVAKKMNYSKNEVDHFCDLVTMTSGRSQLLREKARLRIEARNRYKTSEISVDQFRIIADWYHLAIRELVRMPFFKAEPEWLSQRLNISKADAKAAWDRLCRLKFVYQNENKEWVTDDLLATPNSTPSDAIRQCHRQILEKAKSSLQTDTLAQRSHTAIYFGIRSDQIEEAREKIREFRRSLEIDLNRSRQGLADRLYCLSVQFFGLDHEITKNEGKQDNSFC